MIWGGETEAEIQHAIHGTYIGNRGNKFVRDENRE